MSAADGPAYFQVDEIPWPDESTTNAPRELVEDARREGGAP